MRTDFIKITRPNADPYFQHAAVAVRDRMAVMDQSWTIEASYDPTEVEQRAAAAEVEVARLVDELAREKARHELTRQRANEETGARVRLFEAVNAVLVQLDDEEHDMDGEVFEALFACDGVEDPRWEDFDKEVTETRSWRVKGKVRRRLADELDEMLRDVHEDNDGEIQRDDDLCDGDLKISHVTDYGTVVEAS